MAGLLKAVTMSRPEPKGDARGKVKAVDDLAALAERARRAGKSVVLAHGVFDLLHMGHVRHLEAAKREGDVLIVTLTADRYVNKGPGRPVFPELMRAEMVGALGCVDWVGVSNWPTAEGVLRLVRPTVFVKGQDYANEADDVTGGIRREKELVQQIGARVVFTDDITFSSSNLINRHLNVYDAALASHLERWRERDVLSEALDALEAVADKRVLIVGETIVDEYQYTVPMGKSAKENMIASRYEGREVFAGGVIAAANHVADFVREVEVVTLVGEDDSHEDMILASLRRNVKVHFVRRPKSPTTRKVRFVDPGHMRKLFEVYHFDETPVEGRVEQEVCRLIAERAPESDVAIVNDFGHGMMTAPAISTVQRAAPFLAVNAQSNSANHGYNPVTRYARADYICVDAPEARLAVRDRFRDLGELIQGPLRREIDCDRVIVTHGANGCLTFGLAEGLAQVPAFTRQVVDTVGAGDAFLAVTSPLVAGGARMELVGVIGNAVGAMKVGIVGHRRSVEKVPVVKFLTALLK